MKKFRTEAEQQVGANIARIFEACPDSVETKLENFPKYVRRQHLKRFLAMYEIFKLALPVKVFRTSKSRRRRAGSTRCACCRADPTTS